MIKIQNPIQVTDFRIHLSKYFQDSQKQPLLVTSARSWSRVLMDLDDYNDLIDTYEDYQDSITLIDRVNKDSWEYISIDNI